eukprot:9494850-Pyramimonas_sp.AAC.1
MRIWRSHHQGRLLPRRAQHCGRAAQSRARPSTPPLRRARAPLATSIQAPPPTRQATGRWQKYATHAQA